MLGNTILCESNPRGKREEGICSGALKPGSFVERVPSTLPDAGGAFTWRNVTRGNGVKGPLVLVLEDDNQGVLPTGAYTSGARCKLYWPQPGEYMNCLLAESAGTGTVNMENIGDLLAVEGVSGNLMAGGSLASQPFQLCEHLGVAESGPTLHLVQCLGGQA